MNKQSQIVGVIGLVVTVASLYAGMKYGQTSVPMLQGGVGNFQSMTPEQRAQFAQGRGGRGMSAGQNSGGFSNGEIISKDYTSITVKLRDGGSKIIFLSGTTEVSAFTAATKDALEIGKTVMIMGKANSDGSLTAQTIQVRPAMPPVNINLNSASATPNL